MKNPFVNELLPKDALDQATWRTGIIDGENPVQVTIAEQGSLPSSWLQCYTENNTPSVDDQVLVLQTKADYIIVGRIINGGE